MRLTCAIWLVNHVQRCNFIFLFIIFLDLSCLLMKKNIVASYRNKHFIVFMEIKTTSFLV